MKKIWTSLKKHKTVFLFIFIVFIFGIITGFLFYLKQDVSTKESIISSLNSLFKQNVFSIQNIFYHFLILIIILLSSFCFMGTFLLIIYIFLEGISIGFIIPIFFSLYKIHGIFSLALYMLLIKFIYIFLVFFLFIKSCSFFKNYILFLKKKNSTFLKNLKHLILLIIMILLNDFFVYFISNRLLCFFLGNI